MNREDLMDGALEVAERLRECRDELRSLTAAVLVAVSVRDLLRGEQQTPLERTLQVHSDVLSRLGETGSVTAEPRLPPLPADDSGESVRGCPECGERLDPHTGGCTDCGWRPDAESAEPPLSGRTPDDAINTDERWTLR
ncbi:MAG: hypothetical protein KY476_00520 [Planctomycetes bacterium]|nr:hypothetical protein [Planctomycetota bacterium]